MRKALDSSGHRSKKGSGAKYSLPYASTMLPPESCLNCLMAEMIIEMPPSGDADSMCYYCANSCWHECVQFTIEEMQQMGSGFLRALIAADEVHKFKCLLGQLALLESGSVKSLSMMLQRKDGQSLLGLWKCTVVTWHFGNKPRLVSCCAFVFDGPLTDPAQLKAHLNREARSSLVKKARALPNDLYDVLELMYQGKSNQEIAKKLCKSVSCIKGRKSRIMQLMEFACHKDLMDFVYQSGLFC